MCENAVENCSFAHFRNKLVVFTKAALGNKQVDSDKETKPCLCVCAVEGMKVVEIEKCRNDIKKLREEMASRNNR